MDCWKVPCDRSSLLKVRPEGEGGWCSRQPTPAHTVYLQGNRKLINAARHDQKSQAPPSVTDAGGGQANKGDDRVLPALMHLLPDILIINFSQSDHRFITQRRELARFGIVRSLLGVLGTRDGG